MIAVLIIGVAVGPIFILTYSTTKSSKISGYEILACQYANEISSQLQRALPFMGGIIDEARENGNSNIGLEHIFTDSTFQSEIMEIHDFPIWVPLRCNGKKLGFSLYLSPLNKYFLERSLTINEINTSNNKFLKDKRYYRLEIKLVWTLPKMKEGRKFTLSKVIFIND
jgi:hypothetical protein